MYGIEGNSLSGVKFTLVKNLLFSIHWPLVYNKVEFTQSHLSTPLVLISVRVLMVLDRVNHRLHPSQPLFTG